MTTYDYIVRAREAKLQKLSQRRSSLLNRRPGQSNRNEDLEGNESNVQLEKSKSSRRRVKFWENIPFAKLLLMGNNEEVDPGSKENPSDQSNSSPPDTNHRVNLTTDKKHSPFTKDRKNGPIYDFENMNKHGSEIIDQDMHHLRGSPISGNSSPSAHNNFLGVPNISSPKNHITSSRSSMQELVFDDRREDDENDEKRGETFESRFVAISLAKIVTNYVPKYGQIIEEENESERPTGTEVTGRDYRVNL